MQVHTVIINYVYACADEASRREVLGLGTRPTRGVYTGGDRQEG